MIYFFILTNKGTFRDGMELLCFSSYNLLREAKIEIYDKQIYLNCYTFSKFFSNINGKNISEQKLYEFIQILKTLNKEFLVHELAHNKPKKMILTKFVTVEKVKVSYHYTDFTDSNATIHVTSNLPDIIASSQRIEPPLSELIKSNAPNPVSIITLKPTQISSRPNYKLVSESNLNVIKYDNKDIFYLNFSSNEYAHYKYTTYHELLCKHLGQRGIWDELLLKELRMGCYSNILLNSSDLDVIQAITEFKSYFE
jgi:hypothetical protein